jgi:hypothetical protein
MTLSHHAEDEVGAPFLFTVAFFDHQRVVRSAEADLIADAAVACRGISIRRRVAANNEARERSPRENSRGRPLKSCNHGVFDEEGVWGAGKFETTFKTP